MRCLPPEPNPGERISANLIRELIRAIRERTPIGGTGTKVSIGPNGAVISTVPVKNKKTVEAKDKGLFCIKSIEVNEPQSGSEQQTSATLKLGNAYFRVGGKTYGNSEDVTVQASSGQVIAIKVTITGSSDPTFCMETYASIAAMKQSEEDDEYYIIPLYILDSSCKVKCDFRKGPMLSAGEF